MDEYFRDWFDDSSQTSQEIPTYVDHSQHKNVLYDENQRLKDKLKKVQRSAKEVLNIFKNERNLKEKALEELTNTKHEATLLAEKYDQLQNQNVNEKFSWKEKFNDLERQKESIMKNHTEVAQDYLELLSETTISHGYEVSCSRNRIVSKVERYLRSELGKEYKMPKIISRRPKSIASTATEVKRKLTTKAEESPKRKRKRIDNMDFKSISQVSSPTNFYDDDESETSESDSTYTHSSFSIGNETSFSTLEENKKLQRIVAQECKCYEKEGARLVSVAVDTEDLIQDPVISVPLLSEPDEIILPQIEEPLIEMEAPTVVSVKSFNTIAINTEDVPVCTCHATETTKSSSSIAVDTQDLIPTPPPPRVLRLSEHTILKKLPPRSRITRGTCTPQISTRSFGTQYPDLDVNKIFAETIFNLPDFISPINELMEIEETPIQTISSSAQTNLGNVSREIDYVAKTTSCEEQSFIQLGKTVFNLFLERFQKSYKSVNDDVEMRERLCMYMQHQLFNQLTFDDCLATFNSMPESMKIESEESSLNERKPIVEMLQTLDAEQAEILENIESVIVPPLIEPIEDIATVMESPQVLIEKDIVSPQKESQDEAKGKPSMSDLFGDFDELSEDQLQNVIRSERSLVLSGNNSPERTSMLEDSSRSSSPASLHENSSVSPSSIRSPSPFSSDCDEDEITPEMKDVKSPSPALIHDYADSLDVSSSSSDEFESPLSPPMEDRGEDTIYFESPASPPPFAQIGGDFEPIEIPSEAEVRQVVRSVINPLQYDPKRRSKLVAWQQRHAITSKASDKKFCKSRKAIKIYLEADWTAENLKTCLEKIESKSELLLIEAIFETVEDNDWQKEISSEFTPPAPPLPPYQQKLILLIKKLAEKNQKLPHLLINDLEMKLFKCEGSDKKDLDYLRNISYYYSALVDLFFDGNSTMVFYFIVKCIYFFSHKAIPMVFVLIKAFPLALPKKSLLLKKHSKDIDWENMTGLELSKVRVDIELIDSLELTVLYFLSCIQVYRRKEAGTISDHQLFGYISKFYGFPINFISVAKLLELLMKRFENGELNNLSMSFILLAKRMNCEFAVKTLLKERLMPFLSKFTNEISDDMSDTKIEQICMLIDTISSVLKALTNEKEKSFKDIFPMIVNVLGRAEKSQKIQETCIRAILRLQRFIDNHKEIYDILTHHYEKSNSFSETLRHSIVTFIHRKNEIYFKMNST